MIKITRCDITNELEYIQIGSIKIDFRVWYAVEGVKLLERDYVQYCSSYPGVRLPIYKTILPWKSLRLKTILLAFAAGLIVGYIIR